MEIYKIIYKKIESTDFKRLKKSYLTLSESVSMACEITIYRQYHQNIFLILFFLQFLGIFLIFTH